MAATRRSWSLHHGGDERPPGALLAAAGERRCGYSVVTMETRRETYKGHRIEVRPARPPRRGLDAERESASQPELLLDGRRLAYGRLPDGSYYLDDYAYDWRDDLVDLTRRFVDFQESASRTAPPTGTEER